MQLQQETVNDAIKGWHIRFPSNNRDPVVLPFLATEYFEDLEEDFSEELFLVAAKMVRKSCTFFPQVADFYRVRGDAVNDLARKREHQKRLVLPERTGNLTPAKGARNAELLAVVHKAAGGEMPYLEAAEQLEKMLGYIVDWPERKKNHIRNNDGKQRDEGPGRK